MRLRVQESYVIAAVIFAIILAYFASGTIFGGGKEDAEAKAALDTLFQVRTTVSKAQSWREELTLRGRTEALRNIAVRAEIDGVVEETPTAEGVMASEGDVLCRIAVNSREAVLQQAKATLEQRQVEYAGARELAEKGNRSRTAVLQAKANRDLAKADLERAQLALDNTDIKAPFNGLFDRREVEIGDYMRVGDACGYLVEQQPFLIVGQVSERNVAKVTVGDEARARLATGEVVRGRVTHVSKVADEATRTFRVEIETPNEDLSMRDGMTSEIHIELAPRPAHLLSPAYLTLNDQGVVGLRLVDDAGRVAFNPAEILSDTPEGAWVGGLPDEAEIIVLGQEFVRAGQDVTVVKDAEPAPGDAPGDAAGGSGA